MAKKKREQTGDQWRELAKNAGWSNADCDLFVATHPAAKKIRYESKYRHISYDHTSSVSISGTGKDGLEYTRDVFTTRRGSWTRPQKRAEVKTWANTPFEGTWCPCHGAGGCSGKQVITERGFCDCGAFVHPEGKRYPYVDGRKNVHKRNCSLRGTERDHEIFGRMQNLAPVAPAAPVAPEGALGGSAESSGSTGPAVKSIDQPKRVKGKKAKTRIESLSLPGMGRPVATDGKTGSG